LPGANRGSDDADGETNRAGRGLFAVLTARFASWFIEQEEEEEEELLRQFTGEVAALRDEIRLLREGSEASRQAGHTL